MTDGSKYFNAPSYTAAQWTTRNPLLLKGECGFELHPVTSLPWRCKVGPGRWVDLPYQEDLYPFSDVPTNEIGDAAGDLQYLTTSEILKLMLNPFFVPTLSTPMISVNSLPLAADLTLEIGQVINSPGDLRANIDSILNLAATPYIVDSDGFFSNDGAFASLPAALSISGGSVTPSIVTDIIIRLKALLTNAAYTNEIQAHIGVYPKIIWGCSNALTLIPGDWASLSNRKTLITKDFENDYDFGTTGYGFLAIPAMLSPGTPIFTDVTEPDSPGPYAWQSAGTQTINNGVASYSYNTFRTTYSMISASVVRVRS